MDQDSDRPEAPPSVPDEALPTDLQPAEDNPLAQPADGDVPDDIPTQGVGHGDSGGSPEDASVPGDGDEVGGDDASSTTSPNETFSGTEPDA
jgi:hypothetical protein